MPLKPDNSGIGKDIRAYCFTALSVVTSEHNPEILLGYIYEIQLSFEAWYSVGTRVSTIRAVVMLQFDFTCHWQQYFKQSGLS